MSTAKEDTGENQAPIPWHLDCRARLVRGFVVVALVLCACGARTGLDVWSQSVEGGAADVEGPHDAGVDVQEEDVVVFTPTAFCNVSDAGPPASVCSTTLTVDTIITQGGCTNFYVVADNEQGVLEYACDTDASTWARATFEAGTFQGSFDGTFVDVCIGTTYLFQNGPDCQYLMSTWSTAQTIYGNLASGTLTFAYREAEIAGSSCDIPCTAIATVAVE